MRRPLALLAIIVVAAVLVSGAAGDRGRPVATDVTAVDAALGTITAGLAWKAGSCEGATLWSPGEGDAWTFRVPGPCPATSTGRGVSAVSSTGGRIAFLSYVGGNTVDWRLWTASRTSHVPKLIASASADAGDPSPILLGNGDDRGIPYAVGRNVVVLGLNGARTLTWQAAADISALNYTTNRLAVLFRNGDVEVLAGKSAPLILSGVGARSAQAILGGVVYQTAQRIVLRRGNVMRFLLTDPAAKFVSYIEGQLLYLRGPELHMYAWQTGKNVVLRRLPNPSLVDADVHGLVWASGSLLCAATLWRYPKPSPRFAGCTL